VEGPVKTAFQKSRQWDSATLSGQVQDFDISRGFSRVVSRVRARDWCCQGMGTDSFCVKVVGTTMVMLEEDVELELSHGAFIVHDVLPEFTVHCV
jgi:hypothetical protein